jgi:hypothetical protein
MNPANTLGNGALLAPAPGWKALPFVGEIERARFLARQIRIRQLGRIWPGLNPARIAGSAAGLKTVCGREENVLPSWFRALRQPISPKQTQKNKDRF